MKIPWTAKSVLPSVAAMPSGPPSKIRSWVSSTSERCPSIAREAPRQLGGGTLHRPPIERLGRVLAHEVERERDVHHGRRVRASAGRGRVVVVGDPNRRIALQLAGVVGAVGGVRVAAWAHTRLAADVGDGSRDLHIRVVGQPRLTDDHAEADRADRVRAGAVGVGRTDGQEVRGLHRRTARWERERRPVRSVRRGALLVGGCERDPYGARPRRARVRCDRQLGRHHHRELRPVPRPPAVSFCWCSMTPLLSTE